MGRIDEPVGHSDEAQPRDEGVVTGLVVLLVRLSQRVSFDFTRNHFRDLERIVFDRH